MFADNHPSGTAGDGRSIPVAKYRYRTDRPENFVRCSQCGFLNDMMVTQSGDTLNSPGISYSAPVTQTVRLPVPAGAAPISFTETIVEPSVVGGCRFCGTFNEYGKYVGEDFGSMTDLSNQ